MTDSIRIKHWGDISAEDIAADEPMAKRFRDEMDRRRLAAYKRKRAFDEAKTAP